MEYQNEELLRAAKDNQLNTERDYKWRLSGSGRQSQIGILCFDWLIQLIYLGSKLTKKQMAYFPERFATPHTFVGFRILL